MIAPEISNKRNSNEDDDDASSNDRKPSVQPRQGDVPRNYYLYYTVSIDDTVDQMMDIAINNGDSISTLKRRIKEENINTFSSVDARQILLFESTESTQPLDTTLKWSPGVTWGTVTQPLIVKIERRVAVSPWINSSIGEFDLVAQGESGSLWLIISTIFTLLTQNALVQNAQNTPIKWNEGNSLSNPSWGII
jgi:hypothetical protein